MTTTTAHAGRVSFVIPSRNEQPEIVSRTITELVATTSGHDRSIIVVDDASTSPINYLPDSVCVIRNQTPVGVSRARRQGCALADGAVLVSLDAHHTFVPGWLDRLLEHIDTGAVLCPSAADYERTSRIMYGADLRWITERKRAPGKTPGFYINYRYTRPRKAIFDVPSVAGACIAMSRTTYDQLGGFSPMFRVWGYDEQDISLRAHLAGIPVRCVPAALIGHLYRKAPPYRGLTHDVVEYNQIVMIRTIFGEKTAARLERVFSPVRPTAARWLEGTDLDNWRAIVRRHVAVHDHALLAGVRRSW